MTERGELVADRHDVLRALLTATTEAAGVVVRFVDDCLVSLEKVMARQELNHLATRNPRQPKDGEAKLWPGTIRKP